jgi:hypothetical protein
LKRLAALLLLFAAALPAQFVQAVEFPYYLYPRTLWERELVWLKTIGVSTVEFSIPSSWHQIEPGEFDLTGRTSPRRDLVAFVRLLRRLGLRAWVRPLPADARVQRAWLKALEEVLATQTASHGGPIAYVEGRALAIDAAAPPAPVAVISATDPSAFTRSRQALAGAARALLWTDVEDALYPAGWAATPESPLRKGAVGLSGDERSATGALRRDAALLRNWARLFPGLHSVAMPSPAGVTAAELVSPAASAVSITNVGTKPFHDDVRVREPGSKRILVIPGVSVPAGESLWLPLGVSIGPDGLCRECTNFSGAEHIVYATAELLSIEFENGILAMEFAAPAPGEVILQLARQPVGPFLAAGKPTKFDWDDKTLRARLTIPAGSASGNRVRIGIAIEAPDTSAFFNDARRLIIGRKNVVSTSYSSAEVAARSRLRLPEGYTAVPTVKSPDEIDYEIAVPADALHGDWANLALEADGMPLGRARLQLFRPATIRMMEAIQLHFGSQAELTPDPPTAPIEPKAGGNLEISIRNNWPQIRTYSLAAAGEGLEFFPPKTEITVGAEDERRVSLRVFAAEGLGGVRDWHLRVADLAEPGADADLPMRVVLVPRGRTAAWSADLDGDGSREWVLESQKVRAVFSGQDGGRWMEFTWKDTNVNFLPEQGLFAAPGPVEVRAVDGALEFTGKGWKRTARLAETTLTIEQNSPLPADAPTSEKRGGATLTVARPSPTRSTYSFR